MKTYVKPIKKDSGRIYHYFRRGASGRDQVRLHDDREIANCQAQALLVLKAPPKAGGGPNDEEKRIAGKLVGNARGRSRIRKWECDLTTADIVAMLRDQKYRCAVSNLHFDLSWRAGRTTFRNPFAPSIDRRNPKVGYLKSNCRLILSAVNYAINEWGEEVYFEIARAVVRRNLKGKKSAIPCSASVRAIGGAA